jgi:hypothetical protein
MTLQGSHLLVLLFAPPSHNLTGAPVSIAVALNGARHGVEAGLEILRDPGGNRGGGRVDESHLLWICVVHVAEGSTRSRPAQALLHEATDKVVLHHSECYCGVGPQISSGGGALSSISGRRTSAFNQDHAEIAEQGQGSEPSEHSERRGKRRARPGTGPPEACHCSR